MGRMRVEGLRGVYCYLMAVFMLLFSASGLWASTGYEKEIDNISQSMARNIATSGKKKVAVVDFINLNGNVSELGRFMAEEFSTSLLMAKKGFTVIDRAHLRTLLKEHKLSATGLIDPATAKRIGKIAGVDALITGTLTPMGESIKITVKILDTETATLIDANRGNIPMTSAIKKLMEAGVENRGGQKQGNGNHKSPKSGQTKIVENFEFSLLHCKVSDRTVTCTIIVTNKSDNDRKLTIHNHTRLYDNLGNDYAPGDVRIANTSGSVHGDYLYYVGKELISGIPTKTILPFTKVSPDATRISSLKIYCTAGLENKRFWVNFRNVPLTK